MQKEPSTKAVQVRATNSRGQAKRKMTQILSFAAQNGKMTKPVINQDAIEKILSSQLSADLPLFVISITGVYRSGKSFLTSVFVSYLQMLQENPENISEWLSSDQTFSDVEWARGTDSVTHGIWMTSQPYIIDKKNGEKVGVLVMDCQGIYDASRSSETSDAIVTLVAMEMSSVHVVNVSGEISASDLQHIEASVSYSTANGTNPWFNYLLLLHRNWDTVEQLGAGTRYFKAVARDRPLTKIEENVSKAFKHHSEFMLPTPGENVRTASKSAHLQELIKDEETMEFFLYVSHLSFWLFSDLAFKKEYQMSKEKILQTTERFRQHIAGDQMLHIQTQSQLMAVRSIMQVYYELETHHFPIFEEHIAVQAGKNKDSIQEQIEEIRKVLMKIIEDKKAAMNMPEADKEVCDQTWRKVGKLIEEWLADLAELKEAKLPKSKKLKNVAKAAAAVGGVIAVTALSGGVGLAVAGAVAAFEVGAGCALAAAAGGAAVGAAGSGVVGAGMALHNKLSAKPKAAKDKEGSKKD